MERKSGKWAEIREGILRDPEARERYERKRDALVEERRRLLAALAPDDPVFSGDAACGEPDESGSDSA